MLWPDQPEFLQMFSNDGPVTVKVKFADKGCSIARFNMNWSELDRLMNPETGSPFQYLCFDTFRHPIARYEIDPVRNQLTIYADMRESQ